LLAVPASSWCFPVLAAYWLLPTSVSQPDRIQAAGGACGGGYAALVASDCGYSGIFSIWSHFGKRLYTILLASAIWLMPGMAYRGTIPLLWITFFIMPFYYWSKNKQMTKSRGTCINIGFLLMRTKLIHMYAYA